MRPSQLRTGKTYRGHDGNLRRIEAISASDGWVRYLRLPGPDGSGATTNSLSSETFADQFAEAEVSDVTP